MDCRAPGSRKLPLSRPALIALALAAATLLLYSRTFLGDFDFINSDDPDYVTANPHVQSGLNIDSIRYAFTTSFSFNWHPLTWMSMELDYSLWGMRSRHFHFTNVLLHTINTVLLFLIL